MNSFEHFVEQALLWIRAHQERFWTTVGVVVLAGVFSIFFVRQREAKQDQAWMQLGEIHGKLMQNQLEETRKGLDEWDKQFAGSSAASYAQFMKADLLYKSADYVSAAQLYGDLAVNAKPSDLKPLAQSAQSSALEMAGQYAQAKAIAQSFIDKYPDHFLAADVYLTHARVLELSGDAAGARAVYERFVILFPQHPSIAFVRKKIAAK